MRWIVMALVVGVAACAAESPPARPDATPAAAPRPAPRAAARPAPVPPAWRVNEDGVTGCADPAALRLLRDAGDDELRRVAGARAAGGCVTVFRAAAWRLVERGDVMLKLAPADGGSALWFWRNEVAEQRGG